MLDRDDVTEVISDLHTTADDLHIAAQAVQAAEARADMAEETTAIAVAQIDAANERAAEIERAAIETALGVRMTALETEFRTWQENALTSLRQELETLMMPILTQFREMLMELETEESQPSIPANSETPAEVTVPEEQSRVPEKSQENPEPQKPKKRHHWI